MPTNRRAPTVNPTRRIAAAIASFLLSPLLLPSLLLVVPSLAAAEDLVPPKDVGSAGTKTLPDARPPTAELPGTTLPNIVVILADDLGYGDVQALNDRCSIPTPHLNRLAAEGVSFTDAHTPSGVCTPTRYGLLTGRYCWRTRHRRGVLGGYSPHLIEEGRRTVASILRERGYRTAVVGKWHLGLDWARRTPAGTGEAVDFSKPVAFGPNAFGFDGSFVLPASLDIPPYVFVKDGLAVEPPMARQEARPFPEFVREGFRSPSLRFEDVLDRLTAEAVGILRASAKEDRPFFLYFALSSPHKPIVPERRFRGKTDLGPYGDFVHQTDAAVGEVLRALEEAGVAEKTLVLFTSDNGSYMFRLDDPAARDHVDDPSIQSYREDRHRSNHLFRGTKADVWEGGHRVPFIVRWPGKVASGTRRAETICVTDILATCAEIAGAKLDASAGEDSYSFLPLLEGKSWEKPRPPVVHHSAQGMFAIRDGPWKLVLGNGSGGREKPVGKPFAKPYTLFDLSGDVGEREDLALQHPDIVERLEKELEVIRTSGRSVPR